jgi:hypothetical protein
LNDIQRYENEKTGERIRFNGIKGLQRSSEFASLQHLKVDYLGKARLLLASWMLAPACALWFCLRANLGKQPLFTLFIPLSDCLLNIMNGVLQSYFAV